MAAPAAAPASDFASSPSQSLMAWPPTNRKAEDLVSPPLIAMVAVVGTAFLVVFYVRLLSRYLALCRRRWAQWRRRRRLGFSTDLESTGASGGAAFDYFSSAASSNYFSPYGLDDSAIKTLPLSFFTAKAAKHLFYRECAVCLVEFEENDSLRTLPLCAHAFHVDCIDIWLRSHANCPLCRAAVFRQDSSPFVPMRAARIRPSFDDFFFDPPLPPPPPPPPLPPPPPDPDHSFSEITLEDDRGVGAAARNFLLKRSYSFGFERNLAAERMVLDGSTASPWRYRNRGGGFWSKRWPSPFGGGGSSSRTARAFSFRQVAGKSPFFRRRGFFPLSESGVRFSGAGPSSRRSRSMTSPTVIFSRPPAGSASSRLRTGDPEALLSPDHLGSGHLR